MLAKTPSKFSVYVVGSDRGIATMFDNHHMYKTVSNMGQADIVCFIGGADINPAMYGETKLHRTYSSDFSDTRDKDALSKVAEDQLLVGICRGGQFLNVACGGRMFQHVDNHTGDHLITNFAPLGPKYEKEFVVVSTHHQMMIPGPEGEVLAGAQKSTLYCTAEYPNGVPKELMPEWETEVVWYPNHRALCFQPHPEYSRSSMTHSYFFDLLDHVL